MENTLSVVVNNKNYFIPLWIHSQNFMLYYTFSDKIFQSQ